MNELMTSRERENVIPARRLGAKLGVAASHEIILTSCGSTAVGVRRSTCLHAWLLTEIGISVGGKRDGMYFAGY